MDDMIGIIVYGSLLSRRELLRQALSYRQVHPVRVAGFQRSFSQEPCWRHHESSGRSESSERGESTERGVLTVAPHDRGTLNAVLISGLSQRDLPALDHRERGYDRIPVDAGQLSWLAPAPENAPPHSTEPLEQVFIYRGKPDRNNPRLLPHPSYLQLCLAGAGEWGEAFLREFIETTYVGSEPLISRQATGGVILGLPRK